MGNCCTLFNKTKTNKNITVLLTGLDNAGKTTIAKKLIGEPVNNVLQTLGFSLIKLRHHDYNVNLYDLGGSSQIRAIWSKYYMDAHGIIYVVDASDIARLHESKLVFADLLSHENISGKPVLLLANKQDKENALDELDIVDQLNIEFIVNKFRCPTRVEICSALGHNTIKHDPSIVSGYKWLINTIIENYKTINDRVETDMKNYALLIQKDREEWRKRMDFMENHQTQDDEDSIRNGNPFKPIESVIKNGTTKTEDMENESSSSTILKSGKIPLRDILNERVTSIKEAVKDQKQKFNKKYHRHRKKFARFNKTAPMPIETLMKNESHCTIPITTASTSAGCKRPYNYLQNRPKTAPPMLSTVKYKERAWDLDAPLDISILNTNLQTSKELSDSQDVVSFF